MIGKKKPAMPVPEMTSADDDKANATFKDKIIPGDNNRQTTMVPLEDYETTLWRWVRSMAKGIEPLNPTPISAKTVYALPALGSSSPMQLDSDDGAGNDNDDANSDTTVVPHSYTLISCSGDEPIPSDGCLIHLRYHYLDITEERVRGMFEKSEKWRDKVRIYNLFCSEIVVLIKDLRVEDVPNPPQYGADS